MARRIDSEKNDLEDLPPMSTMQKVIIALAVAVFVAIVAYVIIH